MKVARTMTVVSARRYPACNDSETKWFGELPGSWTVIRAKDLFSERNERSLTGDEMLLTVSHITGVTPRSEKNVNMFMAETMEGYKVCHVGDLVINTMWAWMGALGTSPHHGICSPSYGVYAPRKEAPYCARYFDYLLRTPNAIVEMTRFSKGIVSSRLRLYSDKFYQITLPLPPLAEQDAIAAYLDAKTVQIDRKIDLLTQKAAKYRQLKQSIINAAVTRGLDQSVPMKDSGVAWIGEVPAHWKVTRVTDVVVKIGNGVTPRGGSEVYTEAGIPLLRSQNVYDDGLRLADVAYIPETIHAEMRGSQLRPNDILFNITGASISRTCLVPADFPPANVNQHVAFLRVLKSINARFVALFMKSSLIKNYVQIEQNGASKEAFTLKQIADIPLVLPPLSEQQIVVEYLESQVTKIDLIVETVESQIDKLKDLRKALINDVVTGKLRVT